MHGFSDSGNFNELSDFIDYSDSSDSGNFNDSCDFRESSDLMHDYGNFDELSSVLTEFSGSML